MNSKSFLYTGKIESITPSEEENELYIISSDISLHKIKQVPEGQYKLLKQQSLVHIEGLQKALDKR